MQRHICDCPLRLRQVGFALCFSVRAFRFAKRCRANCFTVPVRAAAAGTRGDDLPITTHSQHPIRQLRRNVHSKEWNGAGGTNQNLTAHRFAPPPYSSKPTPARARVCGTKRFPFSTAYRALSWARQRKRGVQSPRAMEWRKIPAPDPRCKSAAICRALRTPIGFNVLRQSRNTPRPSRD